MTGVGGSGRCGPAHNAPPPASNTTPHHPDDPRTRHDPPPLPALLLAAVGPVAWADSPPDVWPAFRGSGNSISAAKALPLKWSPTENVAWTVELPGYGQSSPVVWKDRVFVTSAEGESKDTLHVLRLDLATGKEAWRKSFPNAQRVKATDYVSRSAPTPVVTADRVFALFESGDLLALDHAGKQVWRRNLEADFGPLRGNHGLGTSPVLAGDTLLVLVAQGTSYLLAVDAATGEGPVEGRPPVRRVVDLAERRRRRGEAGGGGQRAGAGGGVRRGDRREALGARRADREHRRHADAGGRVAGARVERPRLAGGGAARR